MSETNDSTTKAIGALAGDIKSLTGIVESLAANQKTQQEQIGELTTAVARTTAQSGRIPAGSIVAIVSPVLAVIALVSATGRTFVQQEIARLEISEQRSVEALQRRLDEDDKREADDKNLFEKLVSSDTDQQVRLAHIESRVAETESEITRFWDWYHVFLVEWGRTAKTVELLEAQQMDTDRSNASLMARQAETQAQLDSAVRRMDAINSNVGQIKSTLRP